MITSLKTVFPEWEFKTFHLGNRIAEFDTFSSADKITAIRKEDGLEVSMQLQATRFTTSDRQKEELVAGITKLLKGLEVKESEIEEAV